MGGRRCQEWAEEEELRPRAELGIELGCWLG